MLLLNRLSKRKIEISCYGDPTDRFVVVRIEDNGSGIPPNIEPEDLFSAFESKTPDGMGVGLFISRSIIQAHGGKLIFDSNYRDGAAFEFRIPIPNLPT